MKNITNKYNFFAALFIFAIAIFSDLATGQDKPVTPKPEPQVQRITGLNAKFIVALISDGNNGAWIGTEDEGIFHCDVDNKITQFTTKNGLGDNNGYALAIDKLGRLWVGHLNTGVSVFNGKDWKNYDVIDGPIGERIFDIKICPKDGDVWIATSAGISRYKIDSDNWEHLTREDGLLEDQASVLAFTSLQPIPTELRLQLELLSGT
jgi:streptogramin lyase